MSSSSSIDSNLSSDSHEEETTEFSSNGGTIEIVTPNNKSVASMTPLVFVVLDCVYYTAGERVTGEILLNVPADTPPGILVLRSSGEEETIVYTGPRNHENKHEAKNKVFDFESKLYEWETHVKEGQYVFPFTFKLPCFAPSTFYFSGEDSSGNYLKGSIAYTISAEFQVPSDSTKSLRHSRQLLIRSTQTRGKVNVCTESAELVPSCCFISKGVTNLKLSVKGEEHSTVEGTVKYKLEPDNSACNAAINQVTGIITLQIDMIMRDRTFTYSKVLSNMSRAAWISARSNLVFEKDFEYCAELKIPGDFQNPATVDTPLIKSKYVIEVILFYDISCGNKPISIALPIYVLPRNLISRETPSLPRNWEPQEHTIVNLVVDDRTSSGNYSDRMAEIV